MNMQSTTHQQKRNIHQGYWEMKTGKPGQGPIYVLYVNQGNTWKTMPRNETLKVYKANAQRSMWSVSNAWQFDAFSISFKGHTARFPGGAGRSRALAEFPTRLLPGKGAANEPTFSHQNHTLANVEFRVRRGSPCASFALLGGLWNTLLKWFWAPLELLPSATLGSLRVPPGLHLGASAPFPLCYSVCGLLRLCVYWFLCLYGKPLASHRLVTKRGSTISDHWSRVSGMVAGRPKPTGYTYIYIYIWMHLV